MLDLKNLISNVGFRNTRNLLGLIWAPLYVEKDRTRAGRIGNLKAPNCCANTGSNHSSKAGKERKRTRKPNGHSTRTTQFECSSSTKESLVQTERAGRPFRRNASAES